MRLLTKEELADHFSSPLFARITAAADKLGTAAWVVGGYVRDLLLERTTNDIDVVAIGSGVALAQEFHRASKGSRLSVFKNFGTAQVKCREAEVEFVGARRESYTRNSRKPIVEDGSLQDDQNRRDFTINALAVCLNKERLGEIIDPFDGIGDLRRSVVKTPLEPDDTFSDDPLRMLRCIRFAAQLNFSIEPKTFEALRKNRQRLSIISAERIASELEKIVMAPAPSQGFAALHRSGILELILPEVAALDGVEKHNGRGHKNNLYHTFEVLDNVARRGGGLYLRIAALLHDIGKPRAKRWDDTIGWTFHNHDFLGEKMVKPLFRRLKFPLDERMKYVEKMVRLHMRPIVIADDIVTDSAVRRLLFDAGNDIDDLMLLCEADITSKNEKRKQTFLNNFRLVREKLVAIEEKDRIRNFQPPVDGEEIMRLFGLPPSREVGTLKTALKDAILDGIVPNEHRAALDFVIERAQTLGIPLLPPPVETGQKSGGGNP